MTTVKNNTYYEQLNKLDPLEEYLYRVLKVFMDNATHKCFPSIQTLEKKFKRCRQTTRKYLHTLRDKGFIHIRERKVKHKVTNNKYNETNEYTLLLEKFGGNIEKTKKSNNDKTEPLILKETDLDKILRELETNHDKESISSALKAMRKNIRNGSIINNMKNYLKTLMDTSGSQLDQINKAIENSSKASSSTSSTKNKGNKNYKSRSIKVKTKFHNFEQRTDKYTPEELEKMVLRDNKRE